MLWKADPAIDAARKAAGWSEFHRTCGLRALYFDHPAKVGKGGTYRFDAFTVRDRTPILLCSETGLGVIGALEAAYRAAGRPVPEAEPWLDLLAGRVAESDDFDDLMTDDFEELL